MWPGEWTFGLIGGLMIGTAAGVFLLFNGRIMGASGVIGSLVDGWGRPGAGERLAFLAALAGVPTLAALLWGAPDTHVTSHPVLLLAGGLLVGIGTRIGSGCTSGHGVCGISRLSRRSFAATLLFLLSGAATLWLARHILGIV